MTKKIHARRHKILAKKNFTRSKRDASQGRQRSKWLNMTRNTSGQAKMEGVPECLLVKSSCRAGKLQGTRNSKEKPLEVVGKKTGMAHDGGGEPTAVRWHQERENNSVLSNKARLAELSEGRECNIPGAARERRTRKTSLRAVEIEDSANEGRASGRSRWEKNCKEKNN